MDDVRYREIELRERLIQTFILISSFFMVFSRIEEQTLSSSPIVVITFFTSLVFGILYIIFSRSQFFIATDIFGILYSFFFTALMFFTFALNLGVNLGIVNYLIYSAIFSFSLLSIETTREFINLFNKIVQYLSKKNPTYLFLLLIILFILFIIYEFNLLEIVGKA